MKKNKVARFATLFFCNLDRLDELEYLELDLVTLVVQKRGDF